MDLDIWTNIILIESQNTYIILAPDAGPLACCRDFSLPLLKKFERNVRKRKERNLGLFTIRL